MFEVNTSGELALVVLAVCAVAELVLTVLRGRTGR